MPEDSTDSERSRGLVHVYTGEGKGKTTAALGLCLRAVGAGWRVYFVQFMKSGAYSEIKALKRMGDQVRLAQCGSGRFVRGTPSREDRQLARQGLEAARTAINSGDYQMVILDESMIALHQGLLTQAQIEALIETCPATVELVLTGRYAPPEIIAQADLVTDMHAVKHYYQKGVKARRGIEK
ncbi:MAG: cob(I)yrinic acid a,c-diamide adenosyltransferase [Desulfobacterales bacterium]